MNRKVIPPVVLVIAAAAGYWYYSQHRHQAEGSIEASGTVEATEAVLGFASGGRIAEVWVREGDRVTAGQLLARLDTLETGARMQQARAQVQAAKAALLEMERGSRIEELEEARAALRVLNTHSPMPRLNCNGPGSWSKARWWPSSSWTGRKWLTMCPKHDETRPVRNFGCSRPAPGWNASPPSVPR
jgi:hypothetical protein